MVRGTNPASSAVYNVELETQAQAWIEEVTGELFQGGFADELRDGRRLCNLVNVIKPGFVRRVNNSPGMPFKQMENISNFLKACRVVGVPEYSLFETVDLFELKDLGIVVKCLHALGGTVQLNCPDFKGPHLGLKPAQKSPPKISIKAKTGRSPTLGQSGLRSSNSRYGVAPASANSPLPAVAAPPEAAQSPQVSPMRNLSSSPVYDSSAPSSPCFDASAGDGTIAAIPSVNEAAVTIPTDKNSAVAQLPPPPFDESAARWGSGERKKAQLPAPVAKAGTSSDGQRLPPPAYREMNGGSPPPAKTATAAATTKPDDVSSQFSQAVRVEDSPPAARSVSPSARSTGGGSRTVSPGRPASTLPKSTTSGASQQAQQSQGRSVASLASTANVSAKSWSPSSRSPSRSPALSPAARSPAARSPVRSEKAVVSPQLSPRSAASSAASRPGPSSTVRGGGFGLDAELAARREATYDHEAEREAQDWIEDVTGEPFVDEFEEELKSGRRLCELINSIKPGAVRRVNDSRMPFKQMENISNFLKACRAVGVTEYSLFETVDLFEGKDLGLVVRCLHALGQTVQKSCPEYDGPRLGIRQTDSNKREWTVEQQRQQVLESSGTMSQLMAGSSKTMERGTIIKEGVTFGASTSGTGDASSSAMWTMGSQATMQRTNISKSGPTFGAEYAGTGSSNTSSSRVTSGCR